MNYKEAKETAEKMYSDVSLHDFTIDMKARIVAVKHGDGSYLEFHHACCKKLSKEWFAVFTEHHGYHVYHKEDVEWIKEWIRPKGYIYYNKDI